MYRKLYNSLSIFILISAGCRPSTCALYPDLSTEYGRFQQYQHQTAPVGQPEQFEQLPPLQVLLGSGTPDDLARALTVIRARTIPLDMQGSLGQTALHVAARYGHLEVVQELLDAGVDAQAHDRFNRTAFYYAQRNNHDAIIALLQPQVLQPTQQPNVQNAQAHEQEPTRQNTGVRINFKELLLWGCTTGALALLAYKLAQQDTIETHAR